MYCHFQVNPKTLISWFRCLINAGNAGWIPNAVFVPLKGTAGRGWYSLSRSKKEWETKSHGFSITCYQGNMKIKKFCAKQAMSVTLQGTRFRQFAYLSVLKSWLLNCVLWLPPMGLFGRNILFLHKSSSLFHYMWHQCFNSHCVCAKIRSYLYLISALSEIFCWPQQCWMMHVVESRAQQKRQDWMCPSICW